MKKPIVLLLMTGIIILAGIIYFINTKETNDFSEQSDREISGKTNIIHVEYKPDDSRSCILDGIISADYSYKMDFAESNVTKVDLTVTFQLKDKKSSAKLAGNVERIHLPSGFVFWEGSLDGIIIVDNKEIPVIAGFSKKDNEKDICLTITFGVDGNEKEKYPLTLSVGEGFITDEIHKEIESIHNKNAGETSQYK